MTHDATILAACGRSVVAAQDGRGMWRPVERCTRALVSAGTRPAMAMQMTAAMVAVAQAVRDLQARDAAALAVVG